jgi:hypothetical protein
MMTKKLITFEDTDSAIDMLFMLDESILSKDAKGATSEITYLGSELLDKVLLHKVRNKNGHKFLVDGNLLSSMGTPDISTIPVSIKQYVGQNRNCQNMLKMDRRLGRTKFPRGSQTRSMGVARLPRTMWQVGVTDRMRPNQ